MAKERHVSPHHFAYVHTGPGELDSAVECLERAFRERAGAVCNVRGSFLLAPLRDHPRFIALLRRMNLA